MYLRLKFKKEGPVRFIGHLDLMRTMQKTFRRANLPIAYSEGFNPHQIFSFATALAVGVSSEAEYMDLRLTETVPKEVVIAAVNGAAPPGILVVDGVVLQDKEPKAMAALVAADYRITMNSPVISQSMVNAFMSRKEAVVKKKNKKGKINDFDLKPGIYTIVLEENILTMKLATGSSLNIKPEMVLEFMLGEAGETYNRGDFSFHRTELYQDDKGLKPLLQPMLS